ncbi:MAG: hypothetical protein WBD74_08855 [Candidatus Aquilonibacter sp.]
MKRTFVLLAVLLFASARPASPQAPDNTMLLLQRLVTQYGGGHAEVFVGKLPADMPKVPLPGLTILGSIHRTSHTQGKDDTSDSYEVLYDATADSMNAYRSAVVAAGWANKQAPFNGTGGFVSSRGPSSSTYCKANAPMISIWSGADPNDVTITVAQTDKMVDLVCGGPEAMAKLMTAQMQRVMESAMPELRAPSGVTMAAASDGTPMNGRSAAYIHDGTSAGALLDAFAAQLIAAGWQAGVKSSGTGMVSQAFERTDDKKVQWNAVISVIAVNSKPGDFVAFVDATHLSNASSAGFHSEIIRSP